MASRISGGFMAKSHNAVAALAVVVLASSGCSGGDDPAPRSVRQEVSSSSGCTLTQGYWKNHPSAWPVTSLTLGSVSYNQTQLLAILHKPVQGNGLVSLAHQL